MKYTKAALALGLILAGPALAGRKSASPSTLNVGPDLTVNGTVNGVSVRLLMSLFGERTLFLHPEAAARLGFKPGMLPANGTIGKEKFKGSTAVTTYVVAGASIKRRIVWFDRLFTPGFDGVVSPSAVAQDIVTVELRTRQPKETVHTFPLVSVPQTYGRIGTFTRVGNTDVRLTWDLNRETTLVTAAAAADLAAANGGRFVGEKRLETVILNVQRPVRTLMIDTPFVVGPVRLAQATAWVGDYGDTSQVPDDQADPNEIVVVGKGSKVKPIHAILVGRNDMAHCSSITFDKLRRQIRVSCL
jgi:hypothetical protein